MSFSNSRKNLLMSKLENVYVLTILFFTIVLKKALTIFVFNSSRFTFLRIYSAQLSARFNKELAINVVLSVSCNI